MTERATRAVELAIAAAGKMDSGWRQRVYENVADISVLLGEKSDVVPWSERIMGADQFVATFTGFEEEIPDGMDKPSRLIVYTQSDKAINTKAGPRQNLTGEEHVRTDPLWTRPGRLVAQRVRSLPVGSLIKIFKEVEEVDGERKVRVMVHFEILRVPTAGSASSVTPPAVGPERREAADPQQRPDQSPEPEPSLSAPGTKSDDANLSEIEKLFNALGPRQRVAYAHWCREMGITDPMVPAESMTERAIEKLREWVE